MENSSPRCSFRTLCKIVEIKIGGKTRLSDYNQLALRARWLFYHFIFNSGSWNNCCLWMNFMYEFCRHRYAANKAQPRFNLLRSLKFDPSISSFFGIQRARECREGVSILLMPCNKWRHIHWKINLVSQEMLLARNWKAYISPKVIVVVCFCYQMTTDA